MSRRMGWTARLRPEKSAEYRALHAAPWPEILALLQAAHIVDYTIYLHEPENLLFASFTYLGADFEADMEALDRDPRAEAWRVLTAACLEPGEGGGDPWRPLEQVFRLEGAIVSHNNTALSNSET